MADVTEPTASAITPTTSMERRIVSVLFADLVGFTSLSERLDAEDMATVQNAYFASVRETIERHGGVLERRAVRDGLRQTGNGCRFRDCFGNGCRSSWAVDRDGLGFAEGSHPLIDAVRLGPHAVTAFRRR